MKRKKRSGWDLVGAANRRDFLLGVSLGAPLGPALSRKAAGAVRTRAGTLFPPEGRSSTDRRSGARIRQVTSARCVHHHPYLFVPAYDEAMQYLFFVSHRTGRPEIFAEIRASGELIQLTDQEDLMEWSLFPALNGRFVYFLAGTSGWRVETETCRTEKVVDFGAVGLKGPGMVGAGLGTTGLSSCGRWWAVPVRVGEESHLHLVDTETGDSEAILRRDSVGHPQFCPDDPEWILYAGPLHNRTWVVRRSGRENRRLYTRKPRQWIAHEVWIPKRKEVAFVDWPHGIWAIHVETGRERPVTRFNAWHATADSKGARMVSDTNFPDIGLQIFDCTDGIGTPRTLCYPEASSIGEHWDGPFPYEQGPVAVYAPQETHPHPRFSPDGTRVVYTSDRSGFPQVYEVEVSEAEPSGLAFDPARRRS